MSIPGLMGDGTLVSDGTWDTLVLFCPCTISGIYLTTFKLKNGGGTVVLPPNKVDVTLVIIVSYKVVQGLPTLDRVCLIRRVIRY